MPAPLFVYLFEIGMPEQTHTAGKLAALAGSGQITTAIGC
jgi:hypothetical protein